MRDIWTHAAELQTFEDIIESVDLSGPYLHRVVTRRFQQFAYNPEYGDDKECTCGHPYYRHFDSYEHNSPVGCKYCECGVFKLAPAK